MEEGRKKDSDDDEKDGRMSRRMYIPCPLFLKVLLAAATAAVVVVKVLILVGGWGV